MLHPAKTGLMYRFLLALLESYRLRVWFSVAVMLAVILVLTVYNGIAQLVSSPQEQKQVQLQEEQKEKSQEQKTWWVSSATKKIHNPSCRYYGKGKGETTATPKGKDCQTCGGMKK